MDIRKKRMFAVPVGLALAVSLMLGACKGCESSEDAVTLEIVDESGRALDSAVLYQGKDLPGYGVDFEVHRVNEVGRAVVSGSSGPIVIYARGFVPQVFQSHQSARGEISTVVMEEGASINGVVTGEGGQPLAGVKVVVASPIQTTQFGERAVVFPGSEQSRAAMGFKEVVKTNEDGVYHLRGIDHRRLKNLRVGVVGSSNKKMVKTSPSMKCDISHF